jgi:hypothetical protein
MLEQWSDALERALNIVSILVAIIHLLLKLLKATFL